MPVTVQDGKKEDPVQVVVRGHRVAMTFASRDAKKESRPLIAVRAKKATIPDSPKVDLSVLLQELPPYVLRTHPRFKELTGYSGRTMANFDCLKQTLTIKKIMLGNTVAYERESLIQWLESRSRILSEGVTV